MLREALAALLLVALAVAPTAPALGPACDTTGAIERSAQNDAYTGADAPDDLASAVRVAAQGYYWGYLSHVETGGADRFDAYRFSVPAGKTALMVNVTEVSPVIDSYSTQVSLTTYSLTLFGPDGAELGTTTSFGTTLTVPAPAPGEYKARLTSTPLASEIACAPYSGSPPNAPDTTVARNHGLYVGCDPVCDASISV